MVISENFQITRGVIRAAIKAQLLLVIVLAIAVVPFGSSRLAQDRPNQLAMHLACTEANDIILELIELAPHGTGRKNRTMAWFENLFEIGKDFLSLIFDIRWENGLSQTMKAVNRVDIYHSFLHFDLMTIMNADSEVVEDVMPSKVQSPADYITGIQFIKKMIVDPDCRRLLR